MATEKSASTHLFKILLETLLLFSLGTGILFWGRLDPLLFLQGIDLCVVPLCVLYAAYRLALPPKHRRLALETGAMVLFFGAFFFLRMLLNTWTYGGNLATFPNGPSFEIFKTLFSSAFFFAFFRSSRYFFAFLAAKKVSSLRWGMTYHLWLFGLTSMLALLLLGAIIYAFSPGVTCWLSQGSGLYGQLLQRLILGFLIFFSLGFAAVVLLSPIFFGLFATAAFLTARPISRRLQAMTQAMSQNPLAPMAFQPDVNNQDETAALQLQLQSMSEHWSKTLQNLRQERQALDTLLQEHRQRVASVSHELKTPLTIARCHLDRVKNQSGSSRRQDHSILALMENQFEDLQALLGDLEAEENTPTARANLHMQVAPLDHLLKQVAQQWQAFAWDRYRVTLLVNTPPMPVRVAHDALRVRQILGNLIHNALRFNEPGGLIMLELAQTQTALELHVRDTGRGIETEKLAHIWALGATAGAKGRSRTGLGLALVKQWVLAMGWQIEVSSQPGHGATFTVHIPNAVETKLRHCDESSATSGL